MKTLILCIGLLMIGYLVGYNRGFSAGLSVPKEILVQTGIASWYGKAFHGRTTSNQEKFNMHAMTAAHRYLPMGTIVKLTNKKNGREVYVRINDRGPFIGTRVIDVSMAAAEALGMKSQGLAPLDIRVVGT